MDPNLVINRVLRLARLDTTVFDEVRDDVNELVPALVVAAISCLLAGLGSLLFWQVIPAYKPDGVFVNAFLLGSIFMMVMLVVSAGVVFVMMTNVFREQVDFYSLLRTMGYGSVPIAASVLMFIPVIYPLFALAPLGMFLVYMIYAVQSATNADSNHVVMSAFAAFCVFCLLLGIIAVATSDPKVPAGAGIFGLFVDYGG